MTTVRKALLTLRTEGLIQARMGKGSLVRPTRSGPPEIVERTPKTAPHLRPTADPIRQADVPATALLAEVLKVERGDYLFTAEIPCIEEGTGRTVIVRTALPYAVADGTALASDPFGDHADLPALLAQAYGKVSISEYVRAVMPTPEESTALGQPDIAPVFETIRVYAAKGRPLHAITERRTAEGIMLHYPL